MEGLKTRLWVLIFILIVAGVAVNQLSHARYSSQSKAQPQFDFPLNNEGWVGQKITMEQKVYDILETDALVLNNYVKDGKSVALAVVYYPDVKVDFHSPESCYGGKGVKINKQVKTIRIQGLGTVNVNELDIERGNSKELVYYFYKSGNFIGNNYSRLRFNLVINNLFSKEKSGSLIRVSSPFQINSKEAASSLIQFLNDFAPIIKTRL